MFENSLCSFEMLNLLYYTYGINRIEINTIYSVNYDTLTDTRDTGMKYLFYCFSPSAPLLFLHTSL